MHAYLPACLPAGLPACLPVCLPAYLSCFYINKCILCSKNQVPVGNLRKLVTRTPVSNNQTNRVDFFSFTYVATAHLIIYIMCSYFSHSIFRVLVWI
jgi:hypothetical protein